MPLLPVPSDIPAVPVAEVAVTAAAATHPAPLPALKTPPAKQEEFSLLTQLPPQPRQPTALIWQDGAMPSPQADAAPTMAESLPSTLPLEGTAQAEPTVPVVVPLPQPPVFDEDPRSPSNIPPSQRPSPQAAPPEQPPTAPLEPSGETPPPDASVEAADLMPTDGVPLLVRADRQIYDQQQQVVQASGNVFLQFGDAEFVADRLWVNLETRFARADGNVLFTRGEQLIEGDRATYNLSQGAGSIFGGSGSLLMSQFDEDFSTDFSTVLPTDITTRTSQSIENRYGPPGSLAGVSSPGGLTIGTTDADLPGGEGGRLNRLRFEADRLDFDAEGWRAEALRLTNDPFSPPEFELRGDTAILRPLNEEEDELILENGRLVFDQGLSIPLFRERLVLKRGQINPNELNPLPTAVGIDGRDRGGFYLEREFTVVDNGDMRFTVAPQFYLERWLNESESIASPQNFGFLARVGASLGPRTSFATTVNLPGLDLSNFGNRLRLNARVQRMVGTHTLSADYNYRERLFNGSLGFQDVQNSIGLVLQSPIIPLGNTQIGLSYQVSGQYVSAATDRPELISPGDPSNLTQLFRFQGSAALSRVFPLWQGEPLPPTRDQGLRYTPRPVIPNLFLVAGLRGTATYYTSGDLAESLSASIGLQGQVGRFSRPFFDFTSFNITYSKSLTAGDSSPFLFDRDVDQNVLSGGIVQQIYGPFLVGFQTAFNLDSGQEINTDLIFEYSRRAYGLVFRYNPTQSIGYLGFRISDFNYSGRPAAFDDIRQVEAGVIR